METFVSQPAIPNFVFSVQTNYRSNNVTQQPLQANQVGSFTVDSNYKGPDHSPTSNISALNTYNSARSSWILD